MNTSALKAFAPAVRRDLLEAVARKLDVVLAARTPDYRTTLAPQVAALGALAAADRAGLVERVAYTWFNRLAALRYLDARGWHPFRVRVLTPADPGSTQPELLKRVREGALPEELARHTDRARLDDLLDGRLPSANPQAEVYRHLVLASCRYYHALLPDLFERLDDATELLLPDDLLTEHSVAAGFRTAITDADCADVEVLGWLYQFYISEKKDAVMARKAAVPSADIPAVTQLFTPHWIVRYLVENSLGRLWLLNRPASRLRERMPYYVETEPETDFLRVGRPEELRVLDPAVGSGHMLTYAFDLLYAIYEEEGYAASEIPGLILKHNLYGIDIDPRAAQLAELALLFKAREKARRFFQPEQRVQPHVIALQDVRFDAGELGEYVRALNLGPLFDAPVLELLGQFAQATTFGSLIQPTLDAAALADLRRAIEAADVGGQLLLSATHAKVLTVLTQAEYLSARYQVVVANPPYMGSAAMNPVLKELVWRQWTAGKADLYAAFVLRCLALTLRSGFVGMITIPNWMFLSTFEELRKHLLKNASISSLVHCGRGLWGPDFGSCAFVVSNAPGASAVGVFRRLFRRPWEVQSVEEIEANFFDVQSFLLHTVRQTDFALVPGVPIAYWITDRVRSLFSAMTLLGEIVKPRQGMSTNDNVRFLRYWHEVGQNNTGLGYEEAPAAAASRRKWFPYNKGGPLRRWYGNQDYVVNWFDDGSEIKSWLVNNPKDPKTTHWSRRIINTEFYFNSGITWADITTKSFAARYSPPGFLFDVKGSSAFPAARQRLHLLGYMNSKLMHEFMQILNPSATFQVGDLARVPYADPGPLSGQVDAVVAELVAIAKADWDANETSMGFAITPLLECRSSDGLLSGAWQRLEDVVYGRLNRARELEQINNAIWIQSLELGEELQADVSLDDITLSRPDRRADAVAFLSYAVGCMMGRYSLDRPGLVLADAGATVADYLAKVGKPAEALTFAPDADGIIPVLDGEWFADDVVARTHEFLRATFGEATLRGNVRWLEESLGKDLRKYFLTDFYKDHLQTYKKRPIYWLVQSPKKGFSVLVYLHRYTRDTLNVVLNRYLREYQGKLRNRLAQLAQQLAGDALPARDRTAARKEQDRLTKVLHECEEWERQALLPLAQQRIGLDLDDGVKVNYLKLADVLAPIPGLAAAEE